MSFRVFVSGSGNFQYIRNGVDFGDVYELGDGLNRMTSVSGGVSSFVQDEVTGAATPDSPLQQMLNTMGQISGFDLLRSSVTITLATMSPIHIHLAARQSNWLMPDISRGCTLLLSVRDHAPVRGFLQDITPVLDATEMRTFGVLAALAAVFSNFSVSGGRAPVDGSYRLLIQLSH